MKINKDIINFIVTSATAVVCIVLLVFWFIITPSHSVEKRLAIESNIVPGLIFQKVNIKGAFLKFDAQPSPLKGVWNRFRGPVSDNIFKSNLKLRGSLKQDSLPVAWRQKLGEGYAGAAIANGCVYVLDYDYVTESDSLRCFSFSTGEEIWRRYYRTSTKRNHGMSRTVPAVNEKYVVTIGPKCHVLCTNAKTGDYKWGIDLVEQYDTRVPLWYTGQCPLIDNNVAVIAPSGKALLIGIDCETGKVLWETPNSGKWDMSHSSVMSMTIHNRKMYVYYAQGGIAGIAADDPDRGAILWQSSEWSPTVVSPSPVQLPDNRIFMTAGYGRGSRMFQVIKTGDSYQLKTLFELDKEKFACEQHTPVYYKDHLFTIMPSDGGALNRQLVCMDLNGKFKWSSGSGRRFGLGPFIIADDKIYILDDNGLLTVTAADSKSYRELAQVQVLNGKESWGPIAVADGYMVMRDFEELICLNLNI